MDRKALFVIVVVALGGCRSQQGVDNPFLQTTVPPPSTAGATTAPLYGAPSVQIAPGATTVPAPQAPATAVPGPVTTPGTALPPGGTTTPYYPPGGTFDFRQGSTERRLAPLAQHAAPSHLALAQPAGSIAPENLNQVAVSRYGPLQDAEDPARRFNASPPRAEPEPIEINRNTELRIVDASSRESETIRPPTWSPSSSRLLDEPQRLAAGQDPNTLDSASGSLVTGGTLANEQRDVVPAAYFEPAGPARAELRQGRYDHDASYTWLCGRLEHSSVMGQWKLRYIPIDGETDAYGGSVVIANAEQLEGMRPGDFVRVEGGVVDERVAGSRFAPKFEIRRALAQR
jgi:hypothetical protein